jgi:hypothetical protein
MQAHEIMPTDHILFLRTPPRSFPPASLPLPLLRAHPPDILTLLTPKPLTLPKRISLHHHLHDFMVEFLNLLNPKPQTLNHKP